MGLSAGMDVILRPETGQSFKGHSHNVYGRSGFSEQAQNALHSFCLNVLIKFRLFVIIIMLSIGIGPTQ